MQGIKQLSEIRGFPFNSDNEDLRSVERFIIKKYLGIPYRHKGRSLSGLDCYGLIIKIYADFGIELIDLQDEYDERWQWKRWAESIEQYYKKWQKVEIPQLLDIVLFKKNDIVNHGGVVLNNNKFIHCCKLGVIVSRLDEQMWQRRIEGFYRYGNR